MERWLARASRYVVLMAGCAVLGSCRRNAGRSNEEALQAEGGALAAMRTASDRAPSAPTASPEPTSFDAGGLVAATRRTCRVMALRGFASAKQRLSGPSTQRGPDASPKGDDGVAFDREAGAPEAEGRRSLARGDLVPEDGPIELEPGSELTVHATVSTREITLIGPAVAEACPGGDEAVRLAYGRVTAFPGAGVRPGAEVWIATPLGVVRFSDAKIDMAVPETDAARLEVAVVTGQATFVPVAGLVAVEADGGRNYAAPSTSDGNKRGAPAGALPAGESIPLAPGTTLAVRRREASAARWASDLLAACVQKAAAARRAAEAVAAARDAGRESLAELAFAHVKARQQARAACESAWSAGDLAPGGFDAARRSDLENADATWKGAPAASGAYQLTPLPARR